LSEHLFTDQAAPAVVVYAVLNNLLTLAWILLASTALNPTPLTRNEQSIPVLRAARRDGYFALGLYALLAVMAFGFPQVVAFLLAAIWLFWLIYGIRIKAE
jgi:hypothetical protein